MYTTTSLQVDVDVRGSSQGLAVDDGDVVGVDGADAVEPGSGRQQCCSVAGGASGEVTTPVRVRWVVDGGALHRRNGRIKRTVMCTCGGAYV